MPAERFSKRVAESRPFGFDFSGDLDASVSEVLVSAAFTIADPDGGDDDPGAMLVGSPIVAGSIAKHRIEGGFAGVLYRVSAVVVTSAGNTLEAMAPLRVEA